MLFYKKWITKKQSSVYVLLLLSYISILLITLSIAFVFYIKTSRNLNEKIEISNVALLEQLKTEIENNVDSIESLSNDIIFSTNLEQFAKGMPSYSSSDLMRDLSNKNAYSKSLFDYCVYIARTDEIITPNIRMKAEKFFDLMYQFVDMDYQTFRDHYLRGYNLKKFMPVESMNQFESSVIKVLPYIQSFPVSAKESPLGQVIIFIDSKNINSLVDDLHFNASSNIYILDENSNLIVSSDKAPPVSVELEQQLSTQPVQIFNTRLEDEEVVVTQCFSEQTGWKCVMVAPKSIYFKESLNFNILFVSIFIIYLLIGLIAVRIFSKRSYKPIKEISDLIQSQNKTDMTGKNEYENIKNTIISQFQSGREMNEIIDIQMPIVQRDYLVQLVKGLETSYESVPGQLNALGIHFDTSHFLVCMLEFDLDSPFFMDYEEFPEKSLSIARVMANNVGCELFGEAFNTYFLNVGRDQSIYLLNLKKDTPAEEALSAAKKQSDVLIGFSAKDFDLTISIGISELHTGFKNIQSCFDEARKALDRSNLTAAGDAVCFSSLENLDFDYYYPTETEFQLVNYLKNGHYEQAKDLLNSIFEINTASKNISAGAAKSLLYEIASTLLRVLNSSLVAHGKQPCSYEKEMDNLVENPSFDLSKRRFLEWMDQISVLSENKAAGKTKKLVEHIAAFVAANAGENWLDLNYLSQKFEVTPQYISNVFKKYQNQNIKDYIAKLKLQKAKEMLLTTDLSVREISLTLGYANEVGIIRLFKKYEGTTPGEYRLNNKA